MDTTKILDHYRLALVKDKDAFRVLSVIYFQGPTTEEALASTLAAEQKYVTDQTNELYRCGLILREGDDRWTSTILARHIFSELGVQAAGAKALLHDLSLPTLDEAFLEGCIEAQAELNRRSADRVFWNLKCLSLAEDILSVERLSRKERPKAAYALIVGLSPEPQRLGGDAYCNVVFNWHRSRVTDWWKAKGDQCWAAFQHHASSCDRAIEAVDKCNVHLVGSTQESAPPDHSLQVLLFTRVLSSVLGEVTDPAFVTAHRVQENVHSVVWTALSPWSSDISSKSKRNLDQYWVRIRRLAASEKHSSRNLLRDALLAVLNNAVNSNVERCWDLTQTRDESCAWLANSLQLPPCGHDILSELRALKLRVAQGCCDMLPIADVKEVAHLAHGLAEDLDKKCKDHAIKP